MKDQYIAYYSADHQYETFKDLDSAKKWLAKIADYPEGISEETMNGEDFIAKITHRSKFTETANRDKDGYKWNEEVQSYFMNGDPEDEEWPYSNEWDFVGEVTMEELQ